MAGVNRRGIKRHNLLLGSALAGDHANPVSVMNQIVIRNLDNEIIQRLKQLAWQDGRPFDELARRLLIEAVHSRAGRRPLVEFDLQD